MTIVFSGAHSDGGQKPEDHLADVELHFDLDDGLLAGLKLTGIELWEFFSQRRVFFPIARGTKTLVVLRPIQDATADQPLVAAILAAYADAFPTDPA